ncbi:hypothetical protein IFM46972_10146 [Aspergillus udagawae]|uniref:PRISE-like Rossmann-fold domain-containing protein n=1 Tax=Aspergillus udagawae TaxID=91492 RepID=A0A8H3XP90_9EURO|nr:hypothetical protein IFM46972_10146 [Aspergillus udagawae]
MKPITNLMVQDSNHAIVFGAAGLLRWSTVYQLLSGYPTSRSFSRVSAVLNRSVPEAELHWPSPGPDRPQLRIVSGIDLLQGTGDDLAKQLKDKVNGVGQITHVFYFVFASLNEDPIKECTQNCGMMQRLADALNMAAPNLQTFMYSGWYQSSIFQPPLVEFMADNLFDDYARTVAYPWFRIPQRVLQRTQLDLDRAFPGNEAGFRSLLTPVSEKILGRIAIHAALNPDKCGQKIINLMDNDRSVSFAELWPAIANWFGLKGLGPRKLVTL